jgi:hypothetical protein
MELEGTVSQMLPLQQGEGKNGTWRKQEFILETGGQYPKKVCMNLWGEKIDEYQLKVGDKIKAAIQLESREYNGRWYTDVRAWKVEKGSGSVSGNVAPAGGAQVDNAAGMSFSEGDDLPF